MRRKKRHIPNSEAHINHLRSRNKDLSQRVYGLENANDQLRCQIETLNSLVWVFGISFLLALCGFVVAFI